MVYKFYIVCIFYLFVFFYLLVFFYLFVFLFVSIFLFICIFCLYFVCIFYLYFLFVWSEPEPLRSVGIGERLNSVDIVEGVCIFVNYSSSSISAHNRRLIFEQLGGVESGVTGVKLPVLSRVGIGIGVVITTDVEGNDGKTHVDSGGCNGALFETTKLRLV